MLTNGTADGAQQNGHKQSSLEDEAIGGVGFEKGRKHKRLHRHQLDQDVQRRARSVLQWLQHSSSKRLPERVCLNERQTAVGCTSMPACMAAGCTSSRCLGQAEQAKVVDPVPSSRPVPDV